VFDLIDRGFLLFGCGGCHDAVLADGLEIDSIDSLLLEIILKKWQIKLRSV